jgi:hypothetical protein
MKISKHISYEEATISTTATRFNISNDQIMFNWNICKTLQS